VAEGCVTGLLEMSEETANLALYPEVIARLGRRRQVLERMWAGRCTKEIAADLGLSPKTVEYHRAELYRLFKVNNPVSLCRRGLAMGLIRLEEGS
jgi:DNA-binding NarL/FixJ family response regulator